MKKLLSLVLALMMVFGMVSFAQAEDVIKIGVILPLTGGSARLGELQLGGVKYAVAAMAAQCAVAWTVACLIYQIGRLIIGG